MPTNPQDAPEGRGETEALWRCVNTCLVTLDISVQENAKTACDQLHALLADNARLRARLAEAEADTKRLDWIVDAEAEIYSEWMATTQTDHDGNHGEVEVWIVMVGEERKGVNDHLRRAIDAARAQEATDA
jgi:hypothetical protein